MKVMYTLTAKASGDVCGLFFFSTPWEQTPFSLLYTTRRLSLSLVHFLALSLHEFSSCSQSSVWLYPPSTFSLSHFISRISEHLLLFCTKCIYICIIAIGITVYNRFNFKSNCLFGTWTFQSTERSDFHLLFFCTQMYMIHVWWFFILWIISDWKKWRKQFFLLPFSGWMVRVIDHFFYFFIGLMWYQLLEIFLSL